MTKMAKTKLRLCLIGSHVGRNPGNVTTQGEILTDMFLKEGVAVISTSSILNKYLRMIDIFTFLLKRRNDFDIAVIDMYGEKSFLIEDIACRICKIFKKKIVMILHGGTFPGFIRRFPIWSKSVFERADKIVAPSAYLQRVFRDNGYDVETIPNVIDISVYPYKIRRKIRPRLFWMRSFFDYYNPKMAITVLKEVKRKYPDATLVMAGKDKGLEFEVKEYARSVGLENDVRFPGFLDIDGKIMEGTRSDIFLNTNTLDNMPVTVIEACAMGIPVVATDVGGIRDLLHHGKSGLIVPSKDIEKMVSEIERLLEDPVLVEKLSSGGRMIAEKCSWKSVFTKWENLFHDLTFDRKNRAYSK